MTASAKLGFAASKETYLAGFTLVAILLHIILNYALHFPALTYNLPLFAALVIGGVPTVWELLKKLFKLQFGSDLLAGVSIVTAGLLREYLVAAIVVLMLSGGEALEEFATARASSVLDALARRVPSVAHRKEAGGLAELKLADIRIGDELTVLPNEICPVGMHSYRAKMEICEEFAEFSGPLSRRWGRGSKKGPIRVSMEDWKPAGVAAPVPAGREAAPTS
jgi:cation transport ATPase